MAIKIKSLEKISSEKLKYGSLYRDLFLDITISKFYYDDILFHPVNEGDVRISKDLEAIQNSLMNLFTTIKGQRVLFPEYGLNLNYYLFMPITEQTSFAIGRTILDGIKTYEPRVEILNINVEPLPDENQYNIVIMFDVPSLNVTSVGLNLTFDIKNQSFINLTSQTI